MRGETTFWGYGCGRWNTRQLYRVAREGVAREKCCYVKPLAGCLAGQTRLDTHRKETRHKKNATRKRRRTWFHIGFTRSTDANFQECGLHRQLSILEF